MKKLLSADDYLDGILKGDSVTLARAITLIESNAAEHLPLASELLLLCIPYAGKSIRIGISGVPGVGKSSFIEALGKTLTAKGKKVAVLAIDPSSGRSKGSILGDKTRMEMLSADKNAFIRPSPTSGTLGGVALKTRETIVLCEAAGYELIFVETVGVGQSEISVSSMVDFFLLLVLAGAGDELQGIKKGIMEMADAIAVTKADGDNVKPAIKAKAEYINALHLMPPSLSGWIPKVTSCSSQTGEGVKELWKMIEQYVAFTKENQWFDNNRARQNLYWMHETVNEELKRRFYANPNIQEKIKKLEQEVKEGKISSFEAARLLLE
jgi:LAO/AO transport system kinase